MFFFPQFVVATLYVYRYLVTEFSAKFDATPLALVCAYWFSLSVGGTWIVSYMIRLWYPRLGAACCPLCDRPCLLFQLKNIGTLTPSEDLVFCGSICGKGIDAGFSVSLVHLLDGRIALQFWGLSLICDSECLFIMKVLTLSANPIWNPWCYYLLHT